MLGTVEQLTEPLHQELKVLHDYWRGKKRSAKAPSPADIRPEELAPMLTYLALYDVLDGDYRVRHWGTGLVRAYKGDCTGKLMSECDLDGINAQLREQLAGVVRECRPNVIHDQFAKETGGRYLAYERIALPLSADGKVVSLILCGYHVERAS